MIAKENGKKHQIKRLITCLRRFEKKYDVFEAQSLRSTSTQMDA